MGVNVGRGTDLHMPQPLRDGYTVHAVKVQHGSHRVAECVGGTAGKIVAF